MPGTDGGPGPASGGDVRIAPAPPTEERDGAMDGVGAGPAPPKHLWPERHNFGSVL